MEDQLPPPPPARDEDRDGKLLPVMINVKQLTLSFRSIKGGLGSRYHALPISL